MPQSIAASDYRTVVNDHASDEGKIYRNKFPAGSGAEFEDMVTGFTTHREYYGIVQSNSKNVSGQGTLYAAHAAKILTDGIYGGVERTLRPLDGIPKPGITWDCMDAALFYRGQASVIEFTLEPKSLKICGCLTQDTNSTLYAIDNAWYASNHMVNLRTTDIPAPCSMCRKGSVCTLVRYALGIH